MHEPFVTPTPDTGEPASPPPEYADTTGGMADARVRARLIQWDARHWRLIEDAVRRQTRSAEAE